jgi:hypothetical protein
MEIKFPLKLTLIEFFAPPTCSIHSPPLTDSQKLRRSDIRRHGGVAKAEAFRRYVEHFANPAMPQEIGLFCDAITPWPIELCREAVPAGQEMMRVGAPGFPPRTRHQMVF